MDLRILPGEGSGPLPIKELKFDLTEDSESDDEFL